MSNKKRDRCGNRCSNGMIGSQSDLMLFMSVVFFGILFLALVSGNYFVNVRSPGAQPLNLSVNFNEDTQTFFNISINNTAVDAVNNITQVNITLPSGFTFASGTNTTFNNTGGNVSFGGTNMIITFNATATSAYGGSGSVTLSWNSTNGLVFNNTNTYFQFNSSVATPGSYNLTVTMMNSSGGTGSGAFNVTNISVVVNDTTIPNNITFNGTTTPSNGSYVGGNSIFLDLLAYDNGALQTITLALFNSSGAFFNASGSNLSGTFNYTNTTTFSNVSEETKLNRNFTFNITNLADRVYFLNVTLNDTFNNLNATMQTRTITIDSVFPSLSYVGRTDGNASYVARNFIVVEVNNTDTNFNFTNVTLFNATSSIIVRSNLTFNASDFGSNSTNVALYLNFTSLADGKYFFNVTGNDSAGHLNNTLLTRTVVLDTTVPVPSYAGGSDGNGSFVARPFVLVNITLTEANFNFTNISLANASGQLNQTVQNMTNITTQIINFSGLSDGVYFFNVTANDSAGWSNGTLFHRTITIDTIVPVPNISLGTDSNGSYVARNFTIVNITVIDANFNFTNITIVNASGAIKSSNLSFNSTFGISGTGVNRTFAVLYVNFTNLADGVYFINATSNDSAGNINVSNIRTVTIDTTVPVPSYAGGSDGNGSFVARPFVLVNITLTEANFNFTNISLANASGQLNQTVQNMTNITTQIINFSGLSDGVYFFNVTANDSAGWSNGTLFHRTITIDTIVPVPNISLGTDSNGSYVARNFTIVNITVIDANFNFTNITIVNASGAIKSSNLSFNSTFGISGTGVNRTFAVLYVNFTNLADGVYFINATSNDSAGNINVSNIRTVTIDTTVPVPSYGTGTDANNSYVSRNYIIINVTVTELNLNITNISLYNISGFLNQTNITFFNSTNPTYFNYSGLIDGVYFFNVTANDTAGNRNVTLQTRTITVDTVAPVLTISEGTVTSSSVTLSITANDATSGINGSCTVDRSGASVTGTGASQTATENSLTCSTAYPYTVTCLDRAGNSPSKSITVTTLGCDSGAGAGGGSSGGSTGEKWSNTFIVKDEQLSKGYSRELKEKERVSVKIGNINHHVGLVSVDNAAKKATIEVASTPQRITLGEGEVKKVEVTNDSYYDLQVELKSIINGRANVLIKSIKELIAPIASQEQLPSLEGQQPIVGEEEGAPPAEEKSKGIQVAIIWALVLVVIIVIVLVIVFQRKKRFR